MNWYHKKSSACSRFNWHCHFLHIRPQCNEASWTDTTKKLFWFQIQLTLGMTKQMQIKTPFFVHKTNTILQQPLFLSSDLPTHSLYAPDATDVLPCARFGEMDATKPCPQLTSLQPFAALTEKMNVTTTTYGCTSLCYPALTLYKWGHDLQFCWKQPFHAPNTCLLLPRRVSWRNKPYMSKRM